MAKSEWNAPAPDHTAEPARAQRQDDRLLLIATIGSRSYALRAAQVERILPMVAITPLPDATPGVAGLLNLHGEVLLVVDPRPRLEPASADPAARPDQHLVVIAAPTRFALWVDCVERVAQPSPEAWPALDTRHAGVLAPEVVRLDGHVLPVLSIEALDPGAALWSIGGRAAEGRGDYAQHRRRAA